MADRTIVLAQNKRHAVRGVTVVNPQEFSAYQEDDDDLTYVVDMSSYLDGATISSVTRIPTGVTVSNTSNTTTRLTQRLKGFGYVDINVTSSSGEVEQFRITIQPRGNSAFFLSSTGSVPQNTAQMWDVVADVTAANIDSGISWIRTQGYYTVGDGGGALYKRVYAVPSHGAYITSNAATTYWELAETPFNVCACGARGDGVTEDTTAFQAAIDATDNYGGGFVRVPDGTYVLGQVTLKDRVVINGDSVGATILKAKPGLNTHLVISENFATLQAAGNKWLHDADGMPSFLGIKNLQIDGNKASQTAGDGVRLYAKGLILGPLLVRDCYANGIYSEGGDIPGQTDWYDLPEGQSEQVMIRNCGGYGWHLRGPHDLIVPSLVINECGLDGVRVERSAGVYSGVCDFGKAHIYANGGYGVYSNAEFHASHLITESNDKEGLFLDGASYVQIAKLEAYLNCRVSGSYQVLDTSVSEHCAISQLQIVTPYSDSVGGISVNGSHQIFEGIQCVGLGTTSTATGVRVGSTAKYCSLSGAIRAFGGTGGIGLKTNDAAASNYNEFDFSLRDCKTLWNNAAVGAYNTYRIRGRAETGQTFFSGSGPSTTGGREIWDVVGDDAGGGTYLSEIRKTSGFNVDLNSTTEQQFTMGCTELLGLVPAPEGVTVNLYYTGTNTTFAVQYIKVHATSATVLTFYVKLSTAAGSAQTAKLIVTAKL